MRYNATEMRHQKGLVPVLDGVDAWERAGRRLAEVDPGRFRRLLAIAKGMVYAHDGVDDEDSGRGLHSALMLMSGSGDSFDA